MFTGIVQTKGIVASLEEQEGDVRISISVADSFLSDVQLGDSICVSGVCLTVVGKSRGSFLADVSRETLSLTTLGEKKQGDELNLEKSLRLDQGLGGHLVSGHVDAAGVVLARMADARSVRFEIDVPPELSRYIARKGSICVDGISLTVNEAGQNSFAVNIIPHTLEATTLDGAQAGTRVNIEVDILARYLERLQTGEAEQERPAPSEDR